MSAALASLLAPSPIAHAHHATDPALTGNAAPVSDCVFRGLSRTWGCSAVQGSGSRAALMLQAND